MEGTREQHTDGSEGEEMGVGKEIEENIILKEKTYE